VTEASDLGTRADAASIYPGGAVVWLSDPVAENTGDTTSVPPPHGANMAEMTR
jgi:hypothetical protein